MTLMHESATMTGLSDFGPDEFEVGLRIIEADLAHSNLPRHLAEWLRADTLKNLSTRLTLMSQRSAQPAISKEVISRPVFVVGLPRTGTTALIDLLLQDPAARSPLQWEFEYLDDMTTRDGTREDPRIDSVELRLQSMNKTHPIAAQGLHSYGARLPEECNSLLKLSMWSASISVRGYLPRYSEWLRLCAIRQPYAFHHYILQHLQYYGGGGRWTLKSPFHVFDLGAILAEYPDAVFVQTHRDPSQLMASMAGLYSTIRGQAAGSPEAAATGREINEFYGTGIQRALGARQDPALDNRVFDISHRELLRNPMGTISKIYARFGWDLSTEAHEFMRNWVDSPTQRISGVKFTLSDFGLDDAQVDEAFGRYRERFGDLF
jgi:hypothetical protein